MGMDIRTAQLTPEQWSIVDQFHVLVHNRFSAWHGVPIVKCPFDLQTYQEVLYVLQPDTLIECGTAWGGATLFFAHMMDLIGKGQVISIDLMNEQSTLTHYVFRDFPASMLSRVLPVHPRITYLTGDTTTAKTLKQVKQLAHGTTMVVLDSLHEASHVMKECDLYAPMVTLGSYLVVEDIDLNGHPIPATIGQPMAYEATIAFLTHHPQFKWYVELTERYLMSSHAWLVRCTDGD